LFDAAADLGLSAPEYPIYVAYGDPTTRVGTICATYRPGVAYELHDYDISDIPCSTSVAATSTVEGAIGLE